MFKNRTPSGFKTWISSFLVACTMFFLFPATVIAQNPSGDQPQMAEVVHSPKSFAETLETFKEEAAKAGWSVLNVNNMAGVLSKRGFTLHPVVIIDVCSGKYSARILDEDDHRPVSAFMPCRVSIYQTSEGEVYISRMNTAAFLDMMPPEVAEVMSASDREVADMIANTVN